MFLSSRFNKVVTQDTRERLLRAQTNAQPISRGDRHRGAIVAIQSAIASLNQFYMSSAEIDGYFGPRTARAVEAFQRDYGLIADGVVGRQVMNQLDSMYSGEVARPPHGVSIHIGVDRVDPAHYGAPYPLPCCENDAKAMRDLAQDLGYDPVVLVNERATTGSFIGFLRSCSENLIAGDSLLISFSGHGSQVPNTSSDYEPDLLDETLCFYDRMLIDDELYALIATFREGVRVHVIFDSCHSGTAFKILKAPPGDEEALQKDSYHVDLVKVLAKTLPFTGMEVEGVVDRDTSPIPIKSSELANAVEGERPELITIEPDPEKNKEIADLFTDLFVKTILGPPKFLGIETGKQIYEREENTPLYDAVKDLVGDNENAQMACTVTTFSACDDSQTTPAGNPLSLFTYNLTQTWSNRNFAGSYIQFHRSIVNVSRPDATPKINFYGSGGAEARLHERPFWF